MRKWLPLLFILADLLLVGMVYARLPERMPVHWGIHGDVNRYGSRAEGVFLLPLVALAVWMLLRALPIIDPKRPNYARFADTYDAVIAAVVGVLVLMHLGMVGIALGWHIPIQRLVPAGLGVLFFVIGNLLPRARPNWWFGIRTPWTLSNDRVWTRTHRVGGYLMAASGVACMLAAIVASPLTLIVAFAAVLLASLGSTVYSYFAWKQETSR